MVFSIDLLGLALEIPDVVMSGLLASAITLTGVMYSDRRNTKRQEAQQRFTEREAERARTLALRKEVYLPVGAALVNMQKSLNELPATLVTGGSSSALAEFNEVISKVMMVARTDTALLAQALITDYAIVYTKLMLCADPIIDARNTAEISATYRDKAQTNLDRITLEIAKLLESADFHEARYRALERSQMAAQRSVTKHSEEHIAALDTITNGNIRYAKQVIELVEPLASPSVNLLAGIRAELGLDTDFAALSQAMIANRNRMMREMEALMGHIESRLQRENQAETTS